MKEIVLELLPSFLIGDRRDQLLYVLTLGLLGLGTFLCALALRLSRLDTSAVALASAGAAAWLLSNKPAEGEVLFVVQPGNGLTTADLAVVPAALLVLVLCGRRLVRGDVQGRARPPAAAGRVDAPEGGTDDQRVRR